MSSDWERGYKEGFDAGMNRAYHDVSTKRELPPEFAPLYPSPFIAASPSQKEKKRKAKLSAYNKFVKANASKPRFKYKSGSKKGRINMKKIAAAWKKTTTYKKSKKK